MMTVKECYEALKDKCGAEVKVCAHITKREAVEDGWTYTFLFSDGVLKKCEAFNHRELIEVWA